MRVIEQVKRFRPDLRGHAFSDSGVLEEREVHVVQAVSAKDVASTVTDRPLAGLQCRLNAHIIRDVSRAFDTAIEKMSALPPEEQDRIAQWLLGELQDEERWTQAFSSSQDALGRLADEARADVKAGRATQLDPDQR